MKIVDRKFHFLSYPKVKTSHKVINIISTKWNKNKKENSKSQSNKTKWPQPSKYAQPPTQHPIIHLLFAEQRHSQTQYSFHSLTPPTIQILEWIECTRLRWKNYNQFPIWVKVLILFLWGIRPRRLKLELLKIS